MLPSILAAEIRASTRHFLVSAYEAADPFFHGVMRRFVQRPEGLDKGPWLQLGLPFRPGASGRQFFSDFALPHACHAHQEAAWERLASDRLAANTLVATGTGSGKTECFLYPMLDHCRRAHAAGQGPGIKALVIYPMNALATDQARRFAEVIAGTPAFAGLRVGLYVGGGGKAVGESSMSATSVITDREAMRKTPPDVLLTNYKMLDYLLVRPKDRKLWANNGPETLRYAVVDELHTFDGAQGTDLALLLRRLRARLGTPEGAMICAGTSATLGDGDTRPLRDYATQIFGAEFPEVSVITERRDSAAEFLGEQPIVHFLPPRTDLAEALDPTRQRGPEAAVAAWFPVFFPDEPAPADVNAPAWRQHLGAVLKQHLLLHNLLRLLKGGVAHLPTLQTQLASSLPEPARPQVGRVLDAFIALVAWARDPAAAGRPLVTVRVQAWLRELRRLVAEVGPESEHIELRASADLKANAGRIHLPLVQCSDCHTTGWLALRPRAAEAVVHDLDVLYNAWFRGSADVARFYPREAFEELPVELRKTHLCGRCGHVQADAGACSACAHPETVAVGEMQGTVQSQHEGINYAWHDKRCPACGAKDRLLLLGARSATLGAQIIEQAWASPYNDDKKLIAFSDSVQDAAHRAGFFGGRTYQNNVRMAMAKVIAAAGDGPLPWPAFLQRLPRHWKDEAGWTPEAFVTEFIGPNMQWQYEWVRLLEDGRLEPGSGLIDRVAKRLGWQAVAEFSYLSTRGRTLERMGLATLAPDAEAIEPLLAPLRARFAEAFGLRLLSESDLRHWLWGFVLHLRRRGALTHPELMPFLREGGLFAFRRARDMWLPSGAEPGFLSLGNHRDADTLTQSSGTTWYQRWLAATLGRSELMIAPGLPVELYRAAIEALVAEGLLVTVDGAPGTAIALAEERLLLHRDLVQLRSGKGRRRLAVPAAIAERLVDMPCLDAMRERYEHREPAAPDERWMRHRYVEGDLRRVLPAEHTGLLERESREGLERRFKAHGSDTRAWYENLLSATPTLEMGVDIGSLSSVMLCSVPPSQASFLQRIGRAGRRDGNAYVVTLADGASPHDLYFFEQPMEMMAGHVAPPGVFLEAAEVLRRQMMAFCIDAWVAKGIGDIAFPDKTSPALDAIDKKDGKRFPYPLLDFIQQDDAGLLERFFALLGDTLTPRVRERLRDYMLGSAEVDSLRMALLKALEELAFERQSHRKRAEALKARLVQLKAQTRDEATQNEINELDRERDKALELAREIGNRDLLGTLTDAGLIPNYAFPEAGVELKSVVWRKRGENEPGKGGFVTLPAQRYERPASSALSELAPENRFYANQRNVEIDQINMELAKAEPWRLCPSCHHAVNLDAGGDSHPVCPRCADPMWANVSQRRMLLRFRQAMATADDRNSRIDDTTEDREPKFFHRQLLADVDPKEVTIAWRLASDSVAFGFEFIRRASFIDINFGESGRQGDTFKVADREMARPGFKLCRHCGMVQKPPRKRRRDEDEPTQAHARDCPAKGDAKPDAIIDCLYLYREFSSEALRVLVPYTNRGMDETVLQSFMAALQLGLKRRFGGKVDHLRITTQEEPTADGGTKRQYVLLYDAVPGGTGYLHQLLSEDAESLGDVLRMAHDAVSTCGCREQPDRDGCYRCVYQYRQGRAMAKVSRRVAEEVLGELVEHLGTLTRVASVSQILINPNFDSVLESRFVEALQQRRIAPSAADGAPLPVRLVQEIVGGSSGYLLEIGDQRWWMRPQVDLAKSDGVVAACRPDFMLTPVRNPDGRRAIAVFADGWAFHKDKVRDDARKRSALVASGKYWVWSVTWEDVQLAFEDAATPAPHALDREARLGADHPLAVKLATVLAVPPTLGSDGAMVQLLRLLASDGAQADRWLARRAAMACGRLSLAPGDPAMPSARKSFDALLPALPLGVLDDLKHPQLGTGTGVGSALKIFSLLPQPYIEGRLDTGCGVVLFDAARAPDDVSRRDRWRDWLHAFNVLQGLPNHLLMAADGIAHGDYGDLLAKAVSAPTSVAASAEPWDALMPELLEALRPAASALRGLGVVAPDAIGFEAASANGEVAIEAEMAWLDAKLLVLAPHQADSRARCEAEGWRVVVAIGDDWPKDVEHALESKE